MSDTHEFRITTTWQGNLGSGTSGYRAYSRNHELTGSGKAVPIPGSSDPVFRGDGTRYNPEEMLVASLSACHMLWFLHLCADAGIVVTTYSDAAVGTMRENEDGSGQFARVLLRPKTTITDASRTADAAALHDQAHHLCFIARSVNFPVEHAPEITVAV
jgi:organic hydroperoxide reductase OsmC/OhrA